MTATGAVTELRFALRPLPRTCAPLPGETVSSYIFRLASLNFVDPDALRTIIAGDSHRSAEPRATVLARLSGFSPATLHHALPELAAGANLRGRSVGPGCRLCNAARGAEGVAWVLYTRAEVICRRHRRWIAGASFGHQPDLTDQPEILAAHRSYQRLMRAHGHEKVFDAHVRAARILRSWTKDRFFDEPDESGFAQRMRRFLGPRWTAARDSPFVAAARYPQVVALTRLLASPYWMDLALRDHIAAGRPNEAYREHLVKAVYMHRAAAWTSPGQFVDAFETPRHLAAALIDTYLLLDGPNLRLFLAELRRTVESRYEWIPFPRRFLLDDLHGTGSCDLLVELIKRAITQCRLSGDGVPDVPVPEPA